MPHPIHPSPRPTVPDVPSLFVCCPKQEQLPSATSGRKLGGGNLAEGSFIHSFIHSSSKMLTEVLGCSHPPGELWAVSGSVCVAVIAGDARRARGGWCHQGLMPAGWSEPSFPGKQLHGA